MLFSKADLRRLIIPLVLEQFLAVTIGMADTVMVATAGDAAVAAISAVDTINILLINIFSALATGGAVVASQYLGMRERKKACDAAKQLLYVALLTSLFISAISLLCRRPILNFVFGHVERSVMENAQTYFFLSLLSYPFLAVYNACAALYRSMGNSRISLFTSALMNVINITGNAVTIYGFGLGVMGAGLASLLSRAVGAVVMLWLIQNHHNTIFIHRPARFTFDRHMVRSILSIGVPNGLENGMFQIGKVLVSSLIASFGTAALTANAMANTVASMQVIPGSAMGLAMITVVGQCVGAGDNEQAAHYTRLLMRVTYAAMGALSVAVMLLSPLIIRLFSLSQEASEIALFLMLLHGVCCIFIWPASFALPNALRAAGNAKFTMYVSVASMWTCRIAMSYLLGRAFGLGVKGVWIAMILDWCVRAAFFVTRFRGGKWKRRPAVS